MSLEEKLDIKLDENNDIEEEVQKWKSTFQDFATHVDSFDDKLVLILGISGAGKSTLVNFLIGSVLTRRASLFEERIETDHPRCKIGNTIGSQTLTPQCFRNDEAGITFCDTPGFNGNKAPLIKNFEMISMYLAVKMAKSISCIIIVIPVSHFTTAGKAQSLGDLSRGLDTMFDNLNEVAKSVLFVITCATATATSERIVQRAKDINEYFKSHGEEHEEDDDWLRVVSLIEQNPRNVYVANINSVESKVQIINAIRTLNAPVPKEKFSFRNISNFKADFNGVVVKLIGGLSNMMKKVWLRMIVLIIIKKQFQDHMDDLKGKLLLKGILTNEEYVFLNSVDVQLNSLKKNIEKLNKEIEQKQSDKKVVLFKTIDIFDERGWYSFGLGRTKKKISYKNEAPYHKIEEYYENGELNIIKKEPPHIYEAEYISERGMTGIATFKIFVEQRYLPKEVAAIKALQEQLNQDCDQMQSLEGLRTVMKYLYGFYKNALNEGEDAEATTKLKELQLYENLYESSIEKGKSAIMQNWFYYDFAAKISQYIDNDDDIYQEFLQTYSSWKKEITQHQLNYIDYIMDSKTS